jgi:hypothetical protein
MDKKQAIQKFVQANYNFLFDNSQYEHKYLKKIKHDVFIDKYKVQGVKDKEIVDEFIRYTIQIKRYDDFSNFVQQFSKNRFIKYCNIDLNKYELMYKSTIKDKDDQEHFDELKKTRKFEFLKQKVINEQTEEIRAKKEKIESEIKSILDPIDFEEPDYYEEKGDKFEWWENLDLISNPFPNTNGLSSIENGLFDKILVELEPYRWMLKKINQPLTDLWGKGFFVEGDLGTGKTTFYDFFKPILISKNIEPMKYIPTAKFSLARYNEDFESNLLMKLRKCCFQLKVNVSPEHYYGSQLYLEYMMNLQADKNIEGFLIFIDDLHKHSNIKLVYEFLSHLQLYKNKFLEYGINIVFFVSGLPNWYPEIKTNKKLNSFFDGSYNIKLPEVKPSIASKAISKRLKAFSGNSNRDFPISTNFLKYIFEQEKKNRITANFRSYIDSLKDKLEKGQTDIIGVTPSRIKDKTLISIKAVINSNDHLKNAFHNLEWKGKRVSSETFNKCIELLRHIFLNKVVFEEDKLFKQAGFLMLLKRLSDSQLILKSAYKKGGWKIHPELNSVNEKINNLFQVSLEDYLIQAVGKKYKMEAESKKDDTIISIKNELKHLKKSLEQDCYEELRNIIYDFANSCYFPKSDHEELLRKVSNDNLTISDISNIVFKLAKFIIEIESPALFNVFGKNKLNEIWNTRFRTQEYFLDFYKHVKDNSDQSESFRTRVITSANKAFIELWSEFQLALEIRGYTDLRSINNFTIDYLRSLSFYIEFQRNKSLDDKKYFNLISNFHNEVESSFKGYLGLTSRLIFGDQRFEMYPKSIRNIKKYGSRVEINKERHNEFQSLQRSGFQEVFLSNHFSNTEFYKYIIHPIRSIWSEKDLELFYNIFIKYDQIISHREYDKIDELKKHAEKYIKFSAMLISNFCERVKELFFETSFLFRVDNEIFITFGYTPSIKERISIVEDYKYINQIPKNLFQHNITNAISEGLEQFLPTNFQTKVLDIDLMNIESIYSLIPGETYPVQLGLLKYLINENRIDATCSYGTSLYLQKV